ncbi:MAG TPA: hypothetical protein VMU88_09990 [bacterium]|nr:hypothetical protein [bacterium]
MENLRESGLILFAADDAKRRAFYREGIGLPARFEKENLTCFQFGSSYL